MTTGIRRDQWRGLEQRPIAPGSLDPSVYGGAPPSIDADDAAAAGVATTVSRSDHQHAWTTAVAGTIAPDDTAAEGAATSGARSDHRHAITCGAPAGLTKTATSAESAGTGFARDVHVHATDALPWGIVAYQQLTSGSSAYNDNDTTDFVLTSISVNVLRLYRVNLTSQFSNTITGDWQHQVFAGGTQVGQCHTYNTAAGFASEASGSFLWFPATGTITLDVRVNDTTAAGGTLTYAAAATNPRQFWVEDIGLR